MSLIESILKEYESQCGKLYYNRVGLIPILEKHLKQSEKVVEISKTNQICECGALFYGVESKYCHNCGSKIKWID